MRVNPYLNFNGQTEEAFNFYKSVFGGEFDSLMRFKDMPQSEEKMPEDEGNRIMHMSLPLSKDIVLMGTDISESRGMKLSQGNNMYICLTPDSLDDAKRIYEKLSVGGKVEMPLEKMFWGDYFASFTDKYGINWMIDLEAPKE